MRSKIQSLLLSFGMLAAMPMVASAHHHEGGMLHAKGHMGGFGMSKAMNVPELDANAAAAALTLLAGSTIVLSSRRRRANAS